MNIKDIINGLHEIELDNLTSIKYLDSDTIELTFEVHVVDNEYDVVRIEYDIEDGNFYIEMYSMDTGEKYNTVSKEGFYLAENVIGVLEGISSEEAWNNE